MTREWPFFPCSGTYRHRIKEMRSWLGLRVWRLSCKQRRPRRSLGRPRHDAWTANQKSTDGAFAVHLASTPSVFSEGSFKYRVGTTGSLMALVSHPASPFQQAQGLHSKKESRSWRAQDRLTENASIYETDTVAFSVESTRSGVLPPLRRAVSPMSSSIFCLRVRSAAANPTSPKSSSISSRVLPLVSGTWRRVSLWGCT